MYGPAPVRGEEDGERLGSGWGAPARRSPRPPRGRDLDPVRLQQLCHRAESVAAAQAPSPRGARSEGRLKGDALLIMVQNVNLPVRIL